MCFVPSQFLLSHSCKLSCQRYFNSSCIKWGKKGNNGGGGGKGKLSQSSRKWLKRQGKDDYVKKAKAGGSPSRAIFKLEEIVKHVKNRNNKFPKEEKVKLKFLQPGDTVIDLGAAPGGWSLFAAKKTGKDGTLIAVDLLPLDSNTRKTIETNRKYAQFHFIQGDFTNNFIKQEIMNVLPPNEQNGHSQVDCIISDMAANFTGDKLTDALRTINLCEDSMMFAAGPSCFDELDHEEDESIKSTEGLLRHGGSFLCKYFACGQENEHDLMTAAKTRFKYSTVVKPPASRKESAELYLFATGFIG